jgi:flagellar motility protein MotE (MotC chaperone)
VGDFATQAPDRPEPTPAEKVEHARLRKELDQVMEKYRDLIDKVYGNKRLKDDKERDSVEKELSKVRERMSALRDKLPPEYENHGWIWLFLRKPAEVRTGAR